MGDLHFREPPTGKTKEIAVRFFIACIYSSIGPIIRPGAFHQVVNEFIVLNKYKTG